MHATQCKHLGDNDTNAVDGEHGGAELWPVGAVLHPAIACVVADAGAVEVVLKPALLPTFVLLSRVALKPVLLAGPQLSSNTCTPAEAEWPIGTAGFIQCSRCKMLLTTITCISLTLATLKKLPEHARESACAGT